MGPSWVWVLSKNLRLDPRPGPVRNPAPKITKIPCIYIYIFLYSNPNPSFLHSSAADTHTLSILNPHLSPAIPHFNSVQHSDTPSPSLPHSLTPPSLSPTFPLPQLSHSNTPSVRQRYQLVQNADPPSEIAPSLSLAQ